MFQITNDSLFIFIIFAAIFFVMQIAIAVYMSASLRIASTERAKINKEIFGLVKRIEGLTSNKREQMLRHFDKILANLAVRLPTTIAAQASQSIIETESKILKRLAELEPNIKTDEESQKKMDELIKSMENLEGTIVTLTAETVRKVMVDSRTDLMEQEDYASTDNLNFMI